MFKSFRLETWVTGLALFSMFFGAGNVTFPLLVGEAAGDQNLFAISGLLITAVVMPMVGLIAMLLFGSNYRAFFLRIGKVPGLSLMFLAMALLGPFMVIPRCIAVAYDTLSYQITTMPTWSFSVLACVTIFALIFNRHQIVNLLGYILTPILLGFLLLILATGLINPPSALPVDEAGFGLFLHGIREGYNTLDLIAALFFSTMVWMNIKKHTPLSHREDRAYLIKASIKAAIIGGSLLAIMYLGLSYVSAAYADPAFDRVTSPAQLLVALAFHLLGNVGGVLASIAIALACLTTAMALTAISADFLRTQIIRDAAKLNYTSAVLICLAITFAMSLLGFSGIMRLAIPILFIAYPVYIVVSLFNLGHQVKGITMIKTPALIAFLASFGYFIFTL